MDEPLDLNIYRTLLRDLREQLIENEDAGREAAGTVELDQGRVGRLTRIDALQAQAMSRETQRRRERELRLVEGALRRVESGDYGYCADCGKLIDPRRLRISPATPLCIRCADQRTP